MPAAARLAVIAFLQAWQFCCVPAGPPPPTHPPLNACSLVLSFAVMLDDGLRLNNLSLPIR